MSFLAFLASKIDHRSGLEPSWAPKLKITSKILKKCPSNKKKTRNNKNKSLNKHKAYVGAPPPLEIPNWTKRVFAGAPKCRISTYRVLARAAKTQNGSYEF